MNAHDRNNLEFIRNLYDKGNLDLEQWLAEISEDDLAYACELLVAWERELQDQQQEFDLENQIEVLGDYPEANQVLKQFRLTH